MPLNPRKTIEQAADRINELHMSAVRPACPSKRLPDRERISWMLMIVRRPGREIWMIC